MLHEVRWFAEAKLGRQRLRFQLLRATFSWVHRFLTTAVPGGRVVVHALFTRQLDRWARSWHAFGSSVRQRGPISGDFPALVKTLIQGFSNRSQPEMSWSTTRR